ncbi:MAG: UvrB/UvrC motif-containing protein [Pseudomonadales bacterium]
MEGARAPAPGSVKGRTAATGSGRGRKAADDRVPDDPKALGRYIADLETRMLEHARNLEFEEAAALRDRIASVRQERLLG